jgi:hypothetical protein
MEARTSSQAIAGQGALGKATIVGTLLQLAMVIAGHYSRPIQDGFAVGGTGIAAITGFLFSRWAARATRLGSASGGAVAGGVAGLLGTIVSALLGDVMGQTIGIGTISSVVAGLLGGAVGHKNQA